MFQFILCAILATAFMYLSQFKKTEYRLFSFLIVIYIMGFQNSIGEDFSRYIDLFNGILDDVVRPGFFVFEKQLEFKNIELGWFYLCKFLGTFITDFHIVSFVVAIYVCYALNAILKFVPIKWHWLGIFYFYFSTMIFCMSGMRQAFAMASLLLVFCALVQRQWLKTFLFATIGLSMHNSFLVMLPLMSLLFVPDKFLDSRNKQITIILSVLYLSIILFSGIIRQQVFEYLSQNENSDFNRYQVYAEAMNDAKFTFINVAFRTFIYVFFVWAFYKLKGIPKKLLLLGLMSCFMIAILGENSALSRINEYLKFFAVPAICLVPYAVKNKFYGSLFVLINLFYIMRFFYNGLSGYFFRYLDFNTIFI